MKTSLPDTDRDAERLLDIDQVSQIVHCSTRHVSRMVAAGSMPTPIRLGTLQRWSRTAIIDWVEAGCPHGGAAVAATNRPRKLRRAPASRCSQGRR